MSQWFDMWSVENPEERNELQLDGLRDSVALIVDLINTEAALVAPERIFLGGISQGCATAIIALLYCDIRLGGFIGFCSWFPFQEKIESTGNPLQRIRSLFKSASNDSITELINLRSQESALSTPVFLSHSVDDDVVPIQNGKKLSKALGNIGMTVVWQQYEDGGHWINEPQGLDDMAAFIQGKAGGVSP